MAQNTKYQICSYVTSSIWEQNFEVWPTWHVLQISLEDEKRGQTSHPERQHPEDAMRRRFVPEINMWCHAPRKTSWLTGKPGIPADEETQQKESAGYAYVTSQVQDSLRLNFDVSRTYCNPFCSLFAGI